MLKRVSLLFTIIILTLTITAQEKIFTLNDVISGGQNYSSFKPETISSIQWIGDSDLYSYVEKNNIVVIIAKSGKEKQTISLESINSIINSDLKKIPSHEWLSEKQLLLNLENSKTIINIKNKIVEIKLDFPDNAENMDLLKSFNLLAYTIDDNLYIATPQFSKITVTNSNDISIINGQSYHRNEFGISKGTFWSPKGKYLAYARKDESMVGDYPLVNIESREATLENIKYPMAGMASHEVTIGVYSPKTGNTIFLKTGEPKDQYLTNIAWSPDEKTIYIAVLNREQNHMKFNAYSSETGEYITTLFEEKSDKYVEPQNAINWLPEINDQFIWQSMRDGHNHLYLYNTTGKLVKQITQGEWDVTSFIGFDKTGRSLYYTSTSKSPIERHTYKYSLLSNKTECLTKIEGTHTTKISSSGNYAIDNWSNINTPRKIDLIDVSNSTSKNLLAAPNPYIDYKLGETKIFTIKSADDSTDLYCRMITPPGYDPTKKYPVIVYVYGGPHAQLVNNKWMGGARMWQHYMAQKGYIAFTIDNRGSAGRGSNFEQIIHRQLGKTEMTDQMKGIEYLKSLPFVDKNRIGVHGWSYGGFMTTSLMTNYPETFKVGVAGGPVIDWKYYEIMYGERYMDTPQENPEGYANSCVLSKIQDLEGRLLVIHGAIDPIVVWQHSLVLVKECIKEGVQIDYFPYPRHKHNIRGKDRIHLMEKVTLYFDDFL